MKLYLVHCGFYDLDLCDGIFEGHVNMFVVADSFEDARARIKLNSTFQSKRMHVDGLQEISAVDGFELQLVQKPELKGASKIMGSKHRDLAPKPSTPN